MKRFFHWFLALLIMTVFFSGCSKNERDQEERISIVTTIFPLYEWTRQIIGEDNIDKFNLTFLVNSGVDLHSFNPSVSDIARIKTSDVFIYVGGHSDNWFNDVLRDVKSDIIAVNIMEILGFGGVVVHGDGVYAAACHDHDDCDDDHGHTEHHIDEHVWLSLRNAGLICSAIAGILSEIDPDNALLFKDNLDAYTAKLSALDAEYQKVVDTANTRTLLFADRFPFRYFINDYGLNHYAAFAGCSAETEASFTTIISLAGMVNRLGLNAVMVTETSDQSIARTVINNTNNKNQNILVLDSIQSVRAVDARNGATYLSIMEGNLNVLREALQ